MRTILLSLLLAPWSVGSLRAAEIDAAKLPPAAQRAIDFQRDVQPLLAKHCIACHGPEEQNGELRWDRREAVTKGGLSGPAIKKGESAQSRMIIAVSGLDADTRMPPEGDLLSAAEVGVLRAWIDQGAEWPEELAGDKPEEKHWAFEPVRRPPLPDVQPASAAENAIDRFILARLEERGLSLSPPADRAVLLRRLKFDLLGLPPTPEEIAEFSVDQRADAYERWVDRYLASPQYGERWARHWLDIVRFAESHGFEMNQPRPNAWPYRDYVIRAFNADVPYDRFILEQLAGDQLQADEATGFLVAGPWDQVKSPDVGLTLNQRADELHDVVSITGGAFLGLTIGCARCHHHKFDPISQHDYYAVKAVFAGVQHGERALRPADADQRERRAAELNRALARIERELEAFEPLALAGQTIILHPDDKERFAALAPPVGGPIAYEPGDGLGYADFPGDAQHVPTVGRGYVWWPQRLKGTAAAFSPRATGPFRVWLSWGCGWTTHATDAQFLLDRDGDIRTRDDQTVIATVDQQRRADRSDEIPNKKRWSGFLDAGVQDFKPESKILLRAGESDGHVTADMIVLQSAADEEKPRQPRLRVPVTRRANVERFPPQTARFVRFTIHATTLYEPCLDELEVLSAEDSPRNVALATNGGVKLTSSGDYPGNPIHQLKHLNDGQYGNSHSWISSEMGRGWVTIELPQAERIDRIVWSRDRPASGIYSDRLPTKYTIEVAEKPDEWRVVATGDDRLAFGQKVPGGLHAAASDDAARTVHDLFSRRKQIQGELAANVAAPLAYAGRFATPETIQRLHRGDPLQGREAIAPGALARFGSPLALDANTPEQERRRALAKWIADPAHPLTARVMVNRLWQHHFGRGLVDTPSDFGKNGARPTHPELLDWLASDFTASGWSVKQLHRQIVTSATYRQASAAHERGTSVDADDRLLWRYPPRRLEAETLRDAILAVSGNLQERGGGPGFDLFQPNNNYVKVYAPKETFGPDEWRRMIYQTKPRMQLDDVFGAFDCPDAGQAAPRRNRSTTPLQALNLLNSPFMRQQAEIFAARIEQEAGTDHRAQVRRAFALAFGREPRETELAAATKLTQEHGLAPLCRALFNTNEFLFVP